MTDMSKRAEYLNGDLTFSEYYGLLIEHLGEESLRVILPARTPADWYELIAIDEHLNNVPLRQWDNRHLDVIGLVRRTGGTAALAPINGSGGWSMSDSVCVLKETARRYAISGRLEYLRDQLRAECISMGELIELQGLAEHIDPGDVELLEAAGVPEFPESEQA